MVTMWMVARGMVSLFKQRKAEFSSLDMSRKLPSFLIFSGDYKPLPGGIAEHTYKIALQLSNMGARVWVLAPGYAGDDEFDARQPFETYRIRRLPLTDWLAYLVMLLYLILKHNIDVVYCATFYPCAFIVRIARLLVPFVCTITIHGHEVVYSNVGFRQRVKKLLKRLQVATLNSVERVFAVSSFTRGKLIEAGVDENKIAVIYNGVDVSELTDVEVDEDFISTLGVSNRRVILTVARLDVHKGQDMVIRALPLVLREVPDAVYVIVGDGIMRPKLETLVDEFGVRANVIFTGNISRRRVISLVKTCEVLIMVSRVEGTCVEGFGIVFLEAGALRKPVIGGLCGGIPDAVAQGVSGLLVDPTNPNEIHEALSRILRDRELAYRLGKQGYERVQREFTWPKVIERILASLRTLPS